MTTYTDRLRIIADEIMALPDLFRLGVALVRLTGAEVEIARLREALEHYANTENWGEAEIYTTARRLWEANENGYDRAQQALEKGE